VVEGNSAIIYRLHKNCTGCTILYLVVNSFVKLFRVEARHRLRRAMRMVASD